MIHKINLRNNHLHNNRWQLLTYKYVHECHINQIIISTVFFK